MAATRETLDEPAAAARRLVEEHRIHTIEVCFGDLWGYLCGRRVPAGRFLAHAARGFAFPIAPLTWSVTGDIAPSPLANPANGYPNIRFHPDLSTLRPASWREGVAVCVADAHWGAGGD